MCGNKTSISKEQKRVATLRVCYVPIVEKRTRYPEPYYNVKPYLDSDLSIEYDSFQGLIESGAS